MSNDYNLISIYESDDFGIKIYAKSELSLLDQQYISNACSEIYKEIIRQRYINDPKHAEERTNNIAKLKACFPDPIYVKEIPNEYSNDIHDPWLWVTTNKGFFKIGRRTRVIVISWGDSDIGFTAEELFPEENVTKGHKLIHAWGYEDAKRYIQILLETQAPSTD